MKRLWALLLIVILGVFGQAVSAQSSDVWVTIQKFERGMMWWRSDNSTILVLGNQGQVKTFPAGSYSSYRDNRITSSPTGRVPILGFGKVWGNFDSVRRMIGSPTTGEVGIATKITPDSRGTIVTHANGEMYLIGATQWSIINNPGPQPQASIRFFTATVDKIDGPSLRNGTARIYVEWAVDNRPANSNLVFEQVFSNGATRNVELPRTIPIVGSSGQGVVAPVMPPNSTTELVIQLRLISLNSTTVYYTRQIKIAITEPDGVRINQFTAVRSGDGPIRLNWDMTGSSSGRITYIPAGGSTVSTLTNITTAKGSFVTTLEAKQFTYTLELLDSAGQVRATAIVIAALNKITQFVAARNADNSITFTWEISGSISTGRIAYGAPGTPLGSTLTKITAAKGTFTTGTQETVDTFTLELYELPEKVLDSVSLRVPPAGVKINTFTGTRAADNSITFSWDVSGITTGRITYIDAATNNIATLTDINAAKGTYTTTTEAKDNTYTLELYKVPGTILTSAPVKVAPIATPATFTVSPLSINEGGTVTVTWNVPGAQTVNIQMAHSSFPNGTTVIANGSDVLQPSGTLQVAVPSPLDQVTFMVIGTNLPTYTVDVTCNQTAIASGLTSCPLSASTTAPGVYQRFERGFMIWVEGTIWVMYDTGSAASYADTWDGVTLMAVEAAPSGLYQPDRGFGYLWSTNSDVRQRIGWATGPEQSYTVQKQAILPNYSSGEGRLIKLPDGRTAYISSVNGSHSYLLLG